MDQILDCAKGQGTRTHAVAYLFRRRLRQCPRHVFASVCFEHCAFPVGRWLFLFLPFFPFLPFLICFLLLQLFQVDALLFVLVVPGRLFNHQVTRAFHVLVNVLKHQHQHTHHRFVRGVANLTKFSVFQMMPVGAQRQDVQGKAVSGFCNGGEEMTKMKPEKLPENCQGKVVGELPGVV